MYRIILDAETAGEVNNHSTLRVYDLGYKVVDSDFNTVATRNFVVGEIFYNNQLMNTCYYKNKLPQYKKEIAQGIRTVETFANIRKQFIADCKEYGIKQVWAFNAGFDRDALNATINFISNDICNEFMPHGIKWCDIAAPACELICKKESYFDFCLRNGYVSDKGNIRTTAETIYRYLTNNTDFVESHTGLKDVEIESEILFTCLKKRKKMSKEITNAAWRIPQKRFKEYKKKKQK